MADYSDFPFNKFSIEELANLMIDSMKIDDFEFVDALREKIKKRKPKEEP